MHSQGTTAHGCFDIVGDVHGCLEELLALMELLGYRVERPADGFAVTPPAGRKLAFVGDLVNRGPATPAVLRLVMTMVRAGQAFCVPGNQDVKLAKALEGRGLKLSPGAASSLRQLAGEPRAFRAEVASFLLGLEGHRVLDDGNLVIAHAGLKERLHGKRTAKARRLAVCGETTGKTDEFGVPVRGNWAAGYCGAALVVFGHTPVPQPLWLNNTVNIDTGCVYGGRLTALRYPERVTVSVPAMGAYSPTRSIFLRNQAPAPAALP